MNKKILVLIFMLSALILSTTAQRRRRPVAKPSPIELAQKEMNQKNYPQAVEILKKAIEEQKKLRKPKYDIDAMAAMVDSAETLILRVRNTKQVIFLDSVVVEASALLNSIKLTNAVGKVCPSEQLPFFLQYEVSNLGQMIFLNQLKDHAYFSRWENNRLKLHQSVRSGNVWDKPRPIKFIDNADKEQDFPFFLTDGATMYYAAKGNDSFGGWDVFVTRYDYETQTFLKSQNLGMPFNTEANDYFLIIDEGSNTGYLASDRHHGPDSVCIYTFIPESVYKFFSADDSFERVVSAAYINSVKESQKGRGKEIQNWRAEQKKLAPQYKEQESLRFIINDKVVYNDLSQFQNQNAREIAKELLKLYQEQTTYEQLLEMLRKQYAEQRSSTIYDNILQSEAGLTQTTQRIRVLEKQMRNLENIEILK